jgi:hypothetical protein
MLGDRFLIDFDAFGELAMSPRFSCVRSGHLNTTDGMFLISTLRGTRNWASWLIKRIKIIIRQVSDLCVSPTLSDTCLN